MFTNMRPLTTNFSGSSRLEEVKKEIKSLLIAESNCDVTLDRLTFLYKDLIGDDIPYREFKCTSLKEFLYSIPETVHLEKNEQNEFYVRHVESDRTRHLTSLISRQVKSKSSNDNNKKYQRQRLQSNCIEPQLLATVLLKLTRSSPRGRFKKVNLLSEIKNAIGGYSNYTISDLNAQLHELNHILVHDDVHVHLKNGEKSCRIELFIKESTMKRLRQLAAKYSAQGIWCAQLPKVYRQEYGMDLEYTRLGFNNIEEFLGILPDIFKFIKPPGSGNLKVIDCSSSSATNPSTLKLVNGNENLEQQDLMTSDALPIQQLSAKVTKRWIPEEFMNLDDTIGSLEDILKDFSSSKIASVMVSEIKDPSLFWIRLDKSESTLLTLMDSLQDFYTQQQDLDKYRTSCIVAKPGLHVACLYDNLWHRGVIKAVNQNSLALKIHLYDFGTTKVYKAKQVYFLHKNFSLLPAQAIACSLYNIKPTADTETCELKWSKKAIDKFTEKALEKEFVARVFSVDGDSLKVDLLIDTNSSGKAVYMTRWMIKKNLASLGSIDKKISPVKKNRKECCPNLFGKKFQDLEHVKPAKQLEALKKYKTRFKVIQTLVVDEQQKNENLIQDVASKIIVQHDVKNDEQQKTKSQVENVDSKTIIHHDAINDKEQKTNSQFQDVDSKTIIHHDAINDEQQQKTCIFNDRQAKTNRTGCKNINQALKELEKLMLLTKM